MVFDSKVLINQINYFKLWKPVKGLDFNQLFLNIINLKYLKMKKLALCLVLFIVFSCSTDKNNDGAVPIQKDVYKPVESRYDLFGTWKLTKITNFQSEIDIATSCELQNSSCFFQKNGDNTIIFGGNTNTNCNPHTRVYQTIEESGFASITLRTSNSYESYNAYYEEYNYYAGVILNKKLTLRQYSRTILSSGGAFTSPTATSNMKTYYYDKVN
jgi:hypothetical protein